MSAGWVAASVRARGMARHLVGQDDARRLASSASLDEALHALATGLTDRGARPGQDLATAQHAVAAALLWDLRVLAGWLPGGGARLMKSLVAWFEIANIDQLLRQLAGQPPEEPYFELGVLATAWPRLRDAASPAAVRAALAASAWKDTGGDSDHHLRAGVRVRWAQRIAALGGQAADWAAAGLVLLLAGEQFTAGRAAGPLLRAAVASMVGTAAADAATFDELADRMPDRLAWVLTDVPEPTELWRAEAAWWRRVEQDGIALLHKSGFNAEPVLGAAVVLAADARRVRAALELAARGGGPLEAYDAVA